MNSQKNPFNLSKKELEWLQAIVEGRDINLSEDGWTVVSKEIDSYPHIFMIKWKKTEVATANTHLKGELQPDYVYCFRLDAR